MRSQSHPASHVLQAVLCLVTMLGLHVLGPQMADAQFDDPPLDVTRWQIRIAKGHVDEIGVDPVFAVIGSHGQHQLLYEFPLIWRGGFFACLPFLLYLAGCLAWDPHRHLDLGRTSFGDPKIGKSLGRDFPQLADSLGTDAQRFCKHLAAPIGVF